MLMFYQAIFILYRKGLGSISCLGDIGVVGMFAMPKRHVEDDDELKEHTDSEQKRLVAIVTPTYGRARLLRRLYESLRRQKVQNFEWVIVDDGGGMDETRGVVGTFSDDMFPITYLCQRHGGKHRAVNFAMRRVSNPLTFIVDDDDYLVPDATQAIAEVHGIYGSDRGLAGYSFLRRSSSGRVNSRPFKDRMVRASYVQARANRHVMVRTIGDCAEVFATEVLRGHPFPEFPGEFFYSEDGLWVRISAEYDMIFVNRAIYVSDYLSDGLSSHGLGVRLTSPRGMMHRCEAFLNSEEYINLVVIGRMQFLWQVYAKVAGLTLGYMLSNSRRKALCLVLWAPAMLVAKFWMGRYGNDGGGETRRERD